MPPLVIVRTGTANLASVISSFRRLGAEPLVTSDAAQIERARALVLPGVGAFGSAMQSLTRDGLTDILRARIWEGRPTLAICLGLQLLFQASDESPGVEGLSALPGVIRRFEGAVRVPQLGWNAVDVPPDASILRSGFAYFANSYRLSDAPDGWAAAKTDYAGRFVSSIERGPVLACQFHPELSGLWGRELIARWLHTAGIETRQEAKACC